MAFFGAWEFGKAIMSAKSDKRRVATGIVKKKSFMLSRGGIMRRGMGVAGVRARLLMPK